jgi:hypothetical protein
MSKVKKTSEDWFAEIAEEGFIIMDPDGWDRTNYQLPILFLRRENLSFRIYSKGITIYECSVSLKS